MARLEKESNYELDVMAALQNTPHLMLTPEGLMTLVVPQSIHHYFFADMNLLGPITFVYKEATTLKKPDRRL